jgi:hypothetical protein
LAVVAEPAPEEPILLLQAAVLILVLWVAVVEVLVYLLDLHLRPQEPVVEDAEVMMHQEPQELVCLVATVEQAWE